MEEAGEQRKVFQRQPARAVLLDLSYPLDSYTCLSVQEALSNTLSLILQQTGVPCLSHFSLSLLGHYPKCLLPMQPLKGSAQRVQSALKSLAQEAQSLSGLSSDASLGESLQEVLLQFQRLSQNSKQGLGAPSQVEITLVTARDEHVIRQLLLRSADQMNLDQLRKICVVCVSDPDHMMSAPSGSRGDHHRHHHLHHRHRLLDEEEEEEEVEGESQASGLGASHMTCSQMDLGMSMMDIIHSDNDILSLSNIFKQWLLDCSTDTEHVHLIFPASLGDRPLTLKCDLHERIINPSRLLGIGDKFALNTGSSPVRPPTTKMTNSSLYPQLPLYRLRAEALIQPEGVCESVLFGQPLTLRPTACWRLDWEELEKNQQNFAALCTTLQQKGHYLLTSAEHQEFINPRFLILPSPPPSLSLLIKPIAVAELMMPQEVSGVDDLPPQQAINHVENCLENLELKTTYNPLNICSNLYQSLSVNKRGSLSNKGHSRAFSVGAGPHPQDDVRVRRGPYSASRGRDSRSLGPRKQYSNTAKTYSRK